MHCSSGWRTSNTRLVEWVPDCCIWGPCRSRSRQGPARQARRVHRPQVHAVAISSIESPKAVEAAGRSMPHSSDTRGLICTSVTATTVESMVAEINEAAALRADLVELRLDFLQDFAEPERALKSLFGACQSHGLPYIVTYRPNWEGCASPRGHGHFAVASALAIQGGGQLVGSCSILTRSLIATYRQLGVNSNSV